MIRLAASVAFRYDRDSMVGESVPPGLDSTALAFRGRVSLHPAIPQLTLSQFMLNIEALTQEYRRGNSAVTVLDGVTLTVRPGEVCGLIGPSGAGKSTLLRCIALLAPFSEGRLTIEGYTINAPASRADKAYLYQRIGMIFQSFQLLKTRTVLDNVLLPLTLLGKRQGGQQRALALLEAVNLKEKAYAYPADLSGGQQQRVAIARALINEPKLLLCDEPTSALDPPHAQQLASLLRTLQQKFKMAMVVVTHDLSVARQLCDRLAFLEEGRLIEYAETEKLWFQPKAPQTAKFIRAARKLSIPENYRSALQPARTTLHPHWLLMLDFPPASVDRSILTTLAQQYPVACNVIAAQTESCHGMRYGQLLLSLEGSEQDQYAAVSALSSWGVDVGELGYV